MERKKLDYGSGGSPGSAGKSKGGTMRRILLMIAVMAGMAGMSHAVTTDSVMLTVTPVFNLSVNIASNSGTFGSNVTLRSSVTICVGHVSNDGNVTSGWQKQSANCGAGTNAWTLITTGTPDLNQFRLLAVTTGVGVTPNFTSATADRCIEGDHDGSLTVNSTAMTDISEGDAESPYHTTGETRDLWVSIMMPYSVTSGEEKTITLSVQAAVK